MIVKYINPFHATGLFLYLLKTWEKQRFFRGFRKRKVAWIGLRRFYTLWCKYLYFLAWIFYWKSNKRTTLSETKHHFFQTTHWPGFPFQFLFTYHYVGSMTILPWATAPDNPSHEISPRQIALVILLPDKYPCIIRPGKPPLDNCPPWSTPQDDCPPDNCH